MRVKCQLDGELPAGRKVYLAVHDPHPAANEHKYILFISFVVREVSAKEVIFYEEISNFVHRFPV